MATETTETPTTEAPEAKTTPPETKAPGTEAPETPPKSKPKRSRKRTEQEFVIVSVEKDENGLRVWRELPRPSTVAADNRDRAAIKKGMKAGMEKAEHLDAYNGVTVDVLSRTPGFAFTFKADVEEVVVRKVTLEEID
jgi:hypothetical protein